MSVQYEQNNSDYHAVASCEHCDASTPLTIERQARRYRRHSGAGTYHVLPKGWWTPPTIRTTLYYVAGHSYWRLNNRRARIILCPDHAHLRTSRNAMQALKVLLELRDHG